MSQIFIGICTIIGAAFIIFIIKKIIDVIDTKSIINFLKSSEKDSTFTFRSTHSISSKSNISEERVRELCSKSKKISRNTQSKESWSLKK